ncbi:hypothetical protein AOQ84DRAFT_100693 [Glonium stellatum]|uniref:Uncharacterized protein n=1 Tax=Glonium stellatum TaxID=574774 RepID=A0A8E2JQ42_9PEZI|nr:hypothetical protein AOQ84DRAFT_100693 [Glonium stellatum]
MATVLQVVLLVLSIFSNAFATTIDDIDGTYRDSEAETRSLRDEWSSSIIWIEEGRSFVAKLDTLGYPLYIMDKSTAPVLEKESADYYFSTEQTSAVLLNFTLSSDSQTLFLNHQPILPLADNSIPPRIEAYQVPANTSVSRIQDLISYGLLRGWFYGMTIGCRYLGLHYDRLVWADPAAGPYHNHVPTLKFRIMGLVPSAGGDDKILDMANQQVLHVTLADQKHGSSNAPDRSYLITDVKLKSYEDSYPYTSGPTPNNETYVDNCNAKSWRCPDKDIHGEGAPWYRYIWRHKFDRYGRVGSFRYQLLKNWSEVSEFFNDAWLIWLISFASALVAGALAYGTYRFVKFYLRFHAQRTGRIMLAAEQDRLLDGDKDGDEEAGVGDHSGRKGNGDGRGQSEADLPPSYDACMKPLPPSPRTSIDEAGQSEDHSEPNLIVLDEQGDEDDFQPLQSNAGTA